MAKSNNSKTIGDGHATASDQRFSSTTGTVQIENDRLSVTDIPGKDAEWDVIRNFAYSYDGYDHKCSFEQCADVGNDLRRHYTNHRKLPNDLTKLRVALFFEARAFRHCDSDPVNDDLVYVRAVVDQIRNIVTPSEGPSDVDVERGQDERLLFD